MILNRVEMLQYLTIHSLHRLYLGELPTDLYLTDLLRSELEGLDRDRKEMEELILIACSLVWNKFQVADAILKFINKVDRDLQMSLYLSFESYTDDTTMYLWCENEDIADLLLRTRRWYINPYKYSNHGRFSGGDSDRDRDSGGDSDTDSDYDSDSDHLDESKLSDRRIIKFQANHQGQTKNIHSVSSSVGSLESSVESLFRIYDRELRSSNYRRSLFTEILNLTERGEHITDKILRIIHEEDDQDWQLKIFCAFKELFPLAEVYLTCYTECIASTILDNDLDTLTAKLGFMNEFLAYADSIADIDEDDRDSDDPDPVLVRRRYQMYMDRLRESSI